VEAAVQDNATLPGHPAGLIGQIKLAALAARTKHPANLPSDRRECPARDTGNRERAADHEWMGRSGKVKVAGGVYDIATSA